MVAAICFATVSSAFVRIYVVIVGPVVTFFICGSISVTISAPRQGAIEIAAGRIFAVVAFLEMI